MTDASRNEALLVADKITRRFGGLVANQDVALTLGPVLNYRISSMPNGSLVKKVVYSQ